MNAAGKARQKWPGTKFTKPGDRLLAEPCSVRPLPVAKKLQRRQVDPTFQGPYLWQFLTGNSSTYLKLVGGLRDLVL